MVSELPIVEPILTKDTAKADITYWTKKLVKYEKEGMTEQITMCKNMIDHYLEKLSALIKKDAQAPLAQSPASPK